MLLRFLPVFPKFSQKINAITVLCNAPISRHAVYDVRPAEVLPC